MTKFNFLSQSPKQMFLISIEVFLQEAVQRPSCFLPCGFVIFNRVAPLVFNNPRGHESKGGGAASAAQAARAAPAQSPLLKATQRGPRSCKSSWTLQCKFAGWDLARHPYYLKSYLGGKIGDLPEMKCKLSKFKPGIPLKVNYQAKERNR